MDMEQQQIPTATTQPFGLIIPGQNVETNFIPDATGTKFTLTIPFPISGNGSNEFVSMDMSTSAKNTSSSLSPTAVSEIIFFLLPNIPLPADSGAMLYWSAAPMDSLGNPIQDTSISGGFELLGALTPTKSSIVCRTGWATHDQLQSIVEKAKNMQPQQAMSPNIAGVLMTFGVSIEPLNNMRNLQIEEKGVSDLKGVAQKIATDLFNYLQSFDDVGNARSGWMTVPTNVFERWFKRFEGKLHRDPKFFMRNSVE